MTASANETKNWQATVIDAGVGNLGNLARALEHVGARCEITTDPAKIAASRCLLLPGVGAFRPPRETLRGAMEEAILAAREKRAYLLGICVGYQLLFEGGDEFGWTDGLGFLPGTVQRLPETVTLPHIGWNALRWETRSDQLDHPLLKNIPQGAHMYFVHSYAPYGVPPEHRVASATHGDTFTAIAGHKRLFGTQFHPEKSGRHGLRLLANYLELAHAADPGY